MVRTPAPHPFVHLKFVLELCPAGRIHTMEIEKCYKSGPFLFILERSLLNTSTRLPPTNVTMGTNTV